MSQIMVKGEQDSLVITLPESGTNEEVIRLLRSHLEETGIFFQNGQVILDVGKRILNEDDLEALGELFNSWSINWDTMRATNPVTRTEALKLDLRLPFVAEARRSSQSTEILIPEESQRALLIRRTLRSGQIVRYPESVVVLGDVNPGAEIIAGGDVIVLGALRGLIHAGATGDDSATVCALTLSATQLRIGNHIAMAPEEKGKNLFRFRQRTSRAPERARVQEGTIVVERWFGTS
jgi:septum site-determining protein MinC